MTVTAVNARDVALKNTAIRVINVAANYIGLTCPTLQFKYGTDNQPQPVTAVVTATLYGNLQGTVTFTYSGFTTNPVVTGNTVLINPENFTGDVVTINASLNYQGVNYQAVPVTISKIFNQLVAKTTRAIDLLPAYTDGTGYTLPAADNFIELYNGVSKLTTGVVYSPATQTKNGVTATVNTATGLITISEATPNAWTSNSESFTFTATRNLIAYTTAYTITKAKQGTGGAQLAEIALYQWATTKPATPTGTSTYTWLTKAHAYVGTDNWKETVPTSPGGVSIKLWAVTIGILAQSSLSTTTYVVGTSSWAGATIRQITTEANSLIKTYTAIVYQNGLSVPTISGSTTYTWLTNAIAAEPGNWKFTPPAAQTGYTLYQAAVSLIAAQTDTTTEVDWTLASITPVRYYGTDGASARRAYILVPSAVTPASTPATVPTTGNSTYPTSGTWFTTNSNGITWTVAWLANAPNTIAEGFTLYQSDGVFVTNGDTTWGFPYISSLKVGNLAAISVNTGGLTVSDYIKGGNAVSLDGASSGDGFYVNSSGHIRVGAGNNAGAPGVAPAPTGARLKFDGTGLKISNADGVDIFTVVTNANTNASTAVSTANTANSTANTANANATTALQTAGSVTWLGDPSVQIVSGTQLKKIPYTGYANQVWDSHRYSKESYVGGAYASFTLFNPGHVMLGLNSDPALNSSFTNIDYAWYIDSTNTVRIYENGGQEPFDSGHISFSYTSQVLSVIYDGRYVKYYRDGDLIRTKDAGANLKFHVDSSFYDNSTEISSVRFGPVGTRGYTPVKGTDYADGVNARAVNLTTTAQAFSYNVEGTTPSPTTSTITATAQNTSGTVYYQFLVGTTSVQNTTTNTYTYTPAAAFASMPQQITVRVREGGDATTVVASDVMSLVAIKPGIPGENAISGLLTNESTTVPANSAGEVSSFASSGGTFLVFDGVTSKTGSGVTYSVVGTPVGVSISIAATGVYTVTAMSADLGTATLRAVYGGVTIDKVYSISKSKAGANSVVPGPTGPRGSLIGYGSKYGIYSNAWASNLASRVIYNMLNNYSDTLILNYYLHLQVGDTVTLTNSAGTASFTRFWDGTDFIDPAVIIDGNLLVTGTVGANKLASNFLEANWATIGTLRSATSGSRVEIKSDVIKVFEGNTLRVRIGNLSA
jgi:hypothetical protein